MVVTTTFSRRLYAIAAVTILAISTTVPASNGQGLNSQETIDKIIGSKVEEEEALIETDAEKVAAAIEKSSENISIVRKTAKIGEIDIVFLSNASPTEGGLPAELETKVKEHESEIRQLRAEIEGNALLFHAINSRHLLARDVLAIEFNGEETVVIYAAAKPSG